MVKEFAGAETKSRPHSGQQWHRGLFRFRSRSLWLGLRQPAVHEHPPATAQQLDHIQRVVLVVDGLEAPRPARQQRVLGHRDDQQEGADHELGAQLELGQGERHRDELQRDERLQHARGHEGHPHEKVRRALVAALHFQHAVAEAHVGAAAKPQPEHKDGRHGDHDKVRPAAQCPATTAGATAADVSPPDLQRSARRHSSDLALLLIAFARNALRALMRTLIEAQSVV